MVLLNKYLSFVFVFLYVQSLRVQQAAGGVDVLSATGTYGSRHAMLGQVVAQPDHPFLRSSLVRRIRYLMEPDEVDAAFQRREQAHQLACMAFRIIESAEDDVLEAEPPLMAPVLLLQECQHLMDAVRLLSRHHRKALIGERVVQADGQVAVALLEEALHTFPYADGRRSRP